MIINSKEENYQEFLRLRQNTNYTEVTFDEESGGVSAVHREHKFDKQVGPFGCQRGDYERKVADILRKNGYRVLLESEKSRENMKSNDGLLNDTPMDIKTVEGNGNWSISSKLSEADKQGASIVVLYFPIPSLYSKRRVLDGIEKYESNPRIRVSGSITECLILVENQVLECLKRTTTPESEWL